MEEPTAGPLAHTADHDTGCPNIPHTHINHSCQLCRIIELLRTIDDVLALAHNPGLGDGDGLPLLPDAYHEGSYRELERAIAALAATHPVQARHLLARYRDCDRKRQTHDAVIGTAHGNKRRVTNERIVESWPSWVQMQKVRLALEALAGEMKAVDLPGAVRHRWSRAA